MSWLHFNLLRCVKAPAAPEGSWLSVNTGCIHCACWSPSHPCAPATLSPGPSWLLPRAVALVMPSAWKVFFPSVLTWLICSGHLALKEHVTPKVRPFLTTPPKVAIQSCPWILRAAWGSFHFSSSYSLGESKAFTRLP